MPAKTMQAVICHGPEDYRLGEWKVPEPGSGEVVIKVESVGICASDIKCYLGAALFWGDKHRKGYCQAPVIPGHEFVGKVVALGDGAGEKYGLTSSRCPTAGSSPRCCCGSPSSWSAGSSCARRCPTPASGPGRCSAPGSAIRICGSHTRGTTPGASGTGTRDPPSARSSARVRASRAPAAHRRATIRYRRCGGKDRSCSRRGCHPPS